MQSASNSKSYDFNECWPPPGKKVFIWCTVHYEDQEPFTEKFVGEWDMFYQNNTDEVGWLIDINDDQIFCEYKGSYSFELNERGYFGSITFLEWQRIS